MPFISRAIDILKEEFDGKAMFAFTTLKANIDRNMLKPYSRSLPVNVVNAPKWSVLAALSKIIR